MCIQLFIAHLNMDDDIQSVLVMWMVFQVG